MRFANRLGRAVLLQNGRAHDLEQLSQGTFGPDPDDVVQRWAQLREAAAGFTFGAGEAYAADELGPPVPTPRQIVAIGLNYRDHAAETGSQVPEDLVVFTKFQSSLNGPTGTVPLPSENVDYEAELVVVIGAPAHQVSEEDAWAHIAGFTVGQDYSERVVQRRGSPAQFSLGKSFPGFGPTGPAVVTVDELDDPEALSVRTVLIDGDGERVLQDGTTADLIFSVPSIVSRLSQVMTLQPGDLIFTGTPAGVGLGRDPKLFLRPGWTVVTQIEGLGELRNVMA